MKNSKIRETQILEELKKQVGYADAALQYWWFKRFRNISANRHT